MGGREDVWNERSERSGEIARPRFLPIDWMDGNKFGIDCCRRCSKKAREAEERVAKCDEEVDGVGECAGEAEVDGGRGRLGDADIDGEAS